MSNRDKIIFFLYKSSGKVRLIDLVVFYFYQNILMPVIKKYLLLRFSFLKEVHYRNSVLTPQNFNAFLSDIDVSLIIEEESDETLLIKEYLKLKSFFIMLDFPEIYTLAEFTKMNFMKIENCWDLNDFCWNFRKINWCKDELQLTNHALTTIKKKRAIKNSLDRIQLAAADDVDAYNLESFKTLNQLIPSDNNPKTLCYYSVFLANTKPWNLKILVSSKQYEWLNSLMPGEHLTDSVTLSASQKYLKNKEALEFRELYLSKSSIRLKRVLKEDVTSWINWVIYLEKKLGVTA